MTTRLGVSYGQAVNPQSTKRTTVVEAEYAPPVRIIEKRRRMEFDPTFTVLEGSATIDPANLVDGAGATLTAITVAGAALGDFVLVSAPYDLQGILATAYVSAADTVRIRLQNETGGAIDLASGTWQVRVLKQ